MPLVFSGWAQSLFAVGKKKNKHSISFLKIILELKNQSFSQIYIFLNKFNICDRCHRLHMLSNVNQLHFVIVLLLVFLLFHKLFLQCWLRRNVLSLDLFILVHQSVKLLSLPMNVKEKVKIKLFLRVRSIILQVKWF